MTPRRRWLLRNVALLTALLFAAPFGAELAFRSTLEPEQELAIRRVRDYVLQGVVESFEARPYFLYARPRGPDRATNFNAFGFNDRGWKLDRTPGVHRILCLGASATEGGNSLGHDGAFPRQLETFLNARTQRRFEVLNCGISGWTTAETLVAYLLLLQDFQPDLVVLHHAINDSAPRNRLDFKPDYSHYRKAWEAPHFSWLEQRLIHSSKLYTWFSDYRRTPHPLTEMTTMPVPRRVAFDGEDLPPETSRSFRRNMLTIGEHVRSRGGQVLLVTMPWNQEFESLPHNALFVHGMQDHNRITRELAAEHGFLLCDLEQDVGENPKRWAPHWLGLQHLTGEGNQLKAEAMGRELIESWVTTLETH